MNVRVRTSLAVAVVLAATACTTTRSDGHPVAATARPSAGAPNSAPSGTSTAGPQPSGPAAAGGAPRPGAAGAGDPYFPDQGNGGYQVDHYGLTIDYTPSGHRLDGTAHLRAHATQALSQFNLDLSHELRATSVRVDGMPAKAVQPADQQQELVITPATPLTDGASFDVEIAYSGVGAALDENGMRSGWVPTDDGAFVAGEPQGAATWFPVNDTPTDKATYDVTITVPSALAAISNGALLGRSTSNGRTTWRWRLRQPVQSYLITATVGRFTITTGTTTTGLPYLTAVDPSVAAQSAPVVRTLPAIIAYFSSVYGPYPFATAGAIVDDAEVGYALETATRPLFDRAPDEFTFAHELAHQWYGDDVTLRRWRDIWLNEGFAQFSSWLWFEHRGIRSSRSFLDALMAEPALSREWNPPPGNPGQAQDVFAASVYDRGAGALEALREKLGGATFFKIMRGWVAAHAYGNATVEQFTAYAEQVSGRDLQHFFDVWLYRPGKPDQRVP